MAYPRIINLGTEIESELATYLDQSIVDHMMERGPFIDDLIRFQKDYWAKPLSEVRKFPFQGAANIIIPLTAIAFEAIHARSMSTLFGLKQRVSVKAKNSAWVDGALKFENFLGDELERIKFKKQLESSIIEVEKLGTGVGKAGYCNLVKYGVQTIGDEEVEFPITIKRGPTVDSVALSRYLQPFASQDPQTAPWCGEEHSMTEAEIRLHEESGMFRKGFADEVKSYYSTLSDGKENASRYEQSQANLENRTPVFPTRITLYEIWLGYDVAKNGRMREIQVFYHKDSRKFGSIRYNWHRDLRRPYRTGVYFPVEHRWTGVGICKQNEPFQKEVTTQHRQRLDNATLANMRMIAISKLSGYGPREPIFPGKMWFLDDVAQIKDIQMGEIYPSAYNNEHQTLLYSQQRTGIHEGTLGMPEAGTPDTATNSLQRVQEGRKKFDYTFNNIKTFVNEVLIDVVSNIQQFGPRNVSYFEQVDGGRIVEQMLTLPEDHIRDGLIVEIKLAGEQENKIIDRQNWTQIAAMLTQYYTNLIQLAQGMGQPQLIAVLAQKAMVAATEAMRQIAESYDMRNVDRIVFMELIENGLSTAANGGPNQLPNPIGSGGIGQNMSIGSIPPPSLTNGQAGGYG